MLSPTPIKQSYHTAAKFAIVKVDSPIQPAILDNGPARCYKKLRMIQGRRLYVSLKWRLLPHLVLPK